MFRQDISDIKYFTLVPSGEPWENTACVLSCVLDLVEQLQCKYFSPYDVRRIASQLYQEGAIDKYYYVSWVQTFQYFGIDIEIYFEGKDYICKDGEYEIIQLEKPGYAHFVRGDGTGHYTWDSLGIRPQQKEYTIKAKRIIKIKDGLL